MQIGSNSSNLVWNPQDYAPMARYLMPAAQRCVAGLALQPGSRLIDVATGTGNGAVVAAAAGLEVVGIDSSAAQLAEAARRCPTARCELADAEHLPLGDDWADVAISLFGVIFATDPNAALAEMVRCVRPGGQVVVTSLSADGWPARARALLAEAVGRAVSAPPAVWSDPEVAGADARRAGLDDVVITTDPLDYPLDLSRDRVDQVTSELVALRGLRSALGPGQWDSVRGQLDLLLGDGVLRDHYVTVRGRVA